MRTTKLLQKIACCGVLFGIAGIASTAAAQAAAIVEKPAQSAESSERPETPVVAQLPDSPGAMVSKRPATMSQPGGSGELPDTRVSMQRLALQVQSDLSQPDAQTLAQTTLEPRPPAQKPVGTAAAGVIPAEGIAASQPAGVAIAPARQRRVRTIVLRVGAIVGAGVAVGSVVALTQATSSKPPGAH